MLCRARREESRVEINGIAHTMLTVSRFDVCLPFYERLLGFLGLKPVIKGEGFLVQFRVGLHHVCFRAREREDVDRVHEFLLELGAKVVHPPEEGAWAPGYYSVLFEDPDGIRLEVNHVPGKGLLAST